MPNLLEEIKKRNLTVYKINKELGGSSGNCDRLSRKIKGAVPVKYSELQAVCELVGKLSNEPLDAAYFAYEPVVIKLK